jgi:hypothetical protein
MPAGGRKSDVQAEFSPPARIPPGAEGRRFSAEKSNNPETYRTALQHNQKSV